MEKTPQFNLDLGGMQQVVSANTQTDEWGNDMEEYIEKLQRKLGKYKEVIIQYKDTVNSQNEQIEQMYEQLEVYEQQIAQQSEELNNQNVSPQEEILS